MRAGCIALIIYLTFHYEENPPVIIVVGIICFFIFLVMGNDEITIYSDKLVQIDTSIINVILRSKGNVYEIKDIKVASLPENTMPSVTDAGIVLILVSLLPKRTRQNSQRRFYLELKTGETITILSDLGQKKIEDIVKIINSLI